MALESVKTGLPPDDPEAGSAGLRRMSQAPLIHTDRGGHTWRLGTYICYEDILPRFVQQVMAVRDGHRPDVMVNITNDSWYGDTTEPPIHLALAQFRAVEHRRTARAGDQHRDQRDRGSERPNRGEDAHLPGGDARRRRAAHGRDDGVRNRR